MCTAKSYSIIKETLKSLCCSNGWCYGIFYGFDDTNPLLLTLKDAYYEEQMAALVDNMFLQVHVMGRGVIGQAAFAQNHLWMYSDCHHQRHNNSLGSFESLEDDYEFHYQFSLGIKTIALISVEPRGVVQLGSTHKIPGRTDFVDQVKELFRKMDKHRGTGFSSLSPCDISLFANQKFQHEDFVDANDSLVFPSQSFRSTSELLLDPGLLTLEEMFQENDFAEKISKHCLIDDFSQCFSHQPGTSSTQFTTLLSNDVSQATGLIPLSNLSGYNSPIHKSENRPTNSIQSSLTHAFGSNHEVKCSSLGVEPGLKRPESWNETLIPFTNSDELNYSTNESECISKKCDMGSSNSLFSKLGLDQLLNGSSSSSSSSSFSKSRFDDQSSFASKRRKIDNYTWSHNQVKIQDIPSSYRKLKSPNPVYDPEMKNYSEASTNEGGLCIGGSYSMDGISNSSFKRQEEPAKNGRKKAKPGTKPRPKDRQMIQDRLAELRELIPNGEKMSIDRLLERTIRHLNFMHCLRTHAESLKQVEMTKSRGFQNDHSSKTGGGVTWACEVGDQTMVCPLIVEDLSTPGQMLIEILYEEEGLFLEVVDLIRGFGLTILKGVMEFRETKIWAHFIVESEGTRRVTRHEVFSSLIQLLQMTGQSTMNATDHFGHGIRSGVPLLDNCLPDVSFPVNLADTLQCANS